MFFPVPTGCKFIARSMSHTAANVCLLMENLMTDVSVDDRFCPHEVHPSRDESVQSTVGKPPGVQRESFVRSEKLSLPKTMTSARRPWYTGLSAPRPPYTISVL